MSVEFNSSSGSLKGDGWMAFDDTSKYYWKNGFSAWGLRTACACLALLYLLLQIVTLVLVARNGRAAAPEDPGQLSSCQAKFDNLSLQLTQLRTSHDSLSERRNQLQNEYVAAIQERDDLKEERDRLQKDFSNLTREAELLRSRYDALLLLQERLQEEMDKYNATVCPPEWLRFEGKCYFISSNSATKSWRASRSDCEKKGAHLAMITSKAEQSFVSRFHSRIWIGLSDTEAEGKWKWVDGSSLDGPVFWQKGEPNNSDSGEDCVEVSLSGGGWNDLTCNTELSWVCQK